MSWRNIGVVYRKELTDSLRDRRTVISMIVVPILLMPVLTIVVGVLSARADRQGHAGSAHGHGARRRRFAADSGRSARAAGRADRARQAPITPSRSSNKKIRAAVEIPPDFDATIARGETAHVRIYMYQGELKSGFGADKLQKFFRDLRDRTVRERLACAPSARKSRRSPSRVEEKNVAPPEKVSGAVLGGLVPYFVIILASPAPCIRRWT